MMRKKYSRLRHGMVSVFTAVSLALSGIGYGGLNSNLVVAKADTTDKIVDSASAVNYSSILGRAVDYGILSYEFTQANHMETTLATYRFTGNTNNDVDLSESGTAQFIIGELTEGSKIRLGKVGANTKTFNIEAPAEIFKGFVADEPGTDTGNIIRQDNFKSIATIYPKIAEKSVIEANINRMINNVAEKSETLSQKARSDAYKLDLSGNGKNSDGSDIVHNDGTHYTINIDAPEYENSVVYVNVDDGGRVLANAIASTGQFHIQKRSSTVVVMNMESNNTGYDWKTNTFTGDSIDLRKYDVTVNYGDGVTK
ncbi:MAG: hypothetical protein IJ736_10290, partial [Firmicutes bacterium]|nr:hypothetical protein [Bacillota bacterium]